MLCLSRPDFSFFSGSLGDYAKNNSQWFGVLDANAEQIDRVCEIVTCSLHLAQVAAGPGPGRENCKTASAHFGTASSVASAIRIIPTVEGWVSGRVWVGKSLKDLIARVLITVYRALSFTKFLEKLKAADLRKHSERVNEVALAALGAALAMFFVNSLIDLVKTTTTEVGTGKGEFESLEKKRGATRKAAADCFINFTDLIALPFLCLSLATCNPTLVGIVGAIVPICTHSLFFAKEVVFYKT